MMKSTFAKALCIVSLTAFWPGDSARLTAQTAGVLREVYSGIAGTSVADLTSNVNFPNNPSTQEVLADFEAPTDVAEDYGQRLTAYVVAPTTGNYVFWIASDDNSTLFLSTDDTPAKKRVIASVPGWTTSRAWGTYPQQQSSAIALVAGQRYYIEALMKEGGGGDNLAVRWQLPNATIEEPIPNNRLQVFGLGPPQITQQPANVTVVEGGNATFSVQLASGFGATYQWLRGGVNIAGATNSSYTLASATLGDSSAQFRCYIVNPQGNTNSNTATLTVQSDTTPPTIISVVNLGDNTLLTILFSEPVEAASATLTSNYSINNGITVNGASFTGDTRTLVLRTTAMSSGPTYTLTVNNVSDRASIPNTIAANTQRTFTLNFTAADISYLRPGPETRGPAARTTGLVINEIMYNPTNRTDGRNLEFIELYNGDITSENISGYRISGDIDFTFPTNTVIAAGGYLVVAPSPADIQSVYGISGVLGGMTNNLPNGSGTVRLRNKAGAVLLEVNYSSDHPWPVAADNGGHSLALARPSYGQNNPLGWAASDLAGGTPGAGETPAANPYRTIFLNEILAHTDLPDVDFVELFNYSTQAVTLSGCILTDDPTTNKYVFPNPTTIPAMGFMSLDQNQLGFALSSGGETVYLFNPSRSRVIDVVRFKAQANGVSFGRYPDGAPDFHSLAGKTPGAQNSKLLIRDIVINEIMYNPISGSKDDEYIELYNKGASAVPLAGWRLTDGVQFAFPTNFTIPANGYVVIANNAARLITNYPGLNTNNTIGNYDGSLDNGGERIALTMPDQVVGTNGSVIFTNTIHIIVDEVTYGNGGRWGKWSDGGGSSLELIDPNSDNRRPSNWADSDETTKASWTTLQFTGLLDNGNGAADEVQLFLQGAGECLVDDLEVLNSSNANLVSNSSFESGLAGWVPQGNHDQSSLENSGYASSRSLHVRALGRGDTGANRIRSTLTSTLAGGSTATFRAKVRWLSGHPELLLRFHGSWLEAVGAMSLPVNLGTPGARNSRTLVTPNVGPAIFNVSHSPVLPATSQAVTVRAQVHDPSGIAALVLKYRVDPSTNFISVAMNYNGAGLFTAPIPGQGAGTTVAFHIQATDDASPNATTTFPNDAPTRECVVRFGESQPAGSIGAYRLWITQNTLNRWNTRLKLDNGDLDATFVYGNQRVVYNIGTLYSGSPWVSPSYNGPTGGSLCGYIFHFPADDPFLGATDFVMDWPIRDGTAVYEQVAYWMAQQLGLPYNYRRYVHMYVNGNRRGTIYEDTQQPNSEAIREFFPEDTDGDLHKIEDWFEFGDIPSNHEFNVDATLQNFTTTGGAKKLARYRWNWRKRATDAPNNYTNFFRLVDAVNGTGPNYTAAVEALVDVEEWMRIFAVEHIAGNWDSYGYNRGKNMYTYKPENGKWAMMMWDIDFVFSAGADGPQTGMFNSISGDSGLQNLYNHPPFRRAYYRAWYDAVNGPMVATTVGPVMDAKYNALLANGVSVSDPGPGKTYVNDRRNYLIGQLATVAASFAITSNGGNNFSTNHNYITLSGTAPVQVKTIEINGVSYPAIWNTVTGWTINFALNPGVNSLTFQGFDSYGRPLAGVQDSITITYTGVSELPQDYVIINEIMYNAALPDASFVEIHNKSLNTAFDLSNFRLDGADFTFPEGTIIQPGSFLVVASDATGFIGAYGSSIPIAGVFEGQLDNGGETLKLVKPGITPDQDVIIDEVSYDDDAPWPAAADGFGPSLQLIDPAQDNNRVANWAAVTTNAPTSGPQWRFVTVTGTATSSRLYIYLTSGGDVYIDDLSLVSGSVPEVGANQIQNGNFESIFSPPWNTTANTAGSGISTAIKRSGTGSLHLVCAAAGSTLGDSVWQDTLTLVNGQTYTLSYWYLESSNGSGLTLRFSGSNPTSGIYSSHSIAPLSGGNSAGYTPGAPNSIRTNLPVFPLVWLNEIQPNNITGPQDNLGDRDPWVELFNSSGSSVDLTGFYLSDNYTNLVKWAFPGGTTLTAGQYRLVWLDNEPGETSGANLHANFRASTTNGSVVLTKVSGSVTTIVDYLNYAPVNNDRSYGAYPNGTPSKRQKFYFATPATANNTNYPATPVFINEWMASNTGAAVDPADGAFDDWFELYNSGPSIVDLSGFKLADSTNSTPWVIPDGTTIAPGGFLLVWADAETQQNGYGGPDLHADFRLGATGEAIILRAPNDAIVDMITFGPQTNDISQGRWPDANSSIYFMTTPTPRLANTLGTSSNAAPLLSPIGNKIINEGNALAFIASASDPNPGQTLTFSLDLGAPTNVTINPGSGVFSWTPNENQGPGNYPITIRVTDNGSPNLSDAETITVTVNEVNTSPIVGAISDQSINEGATVSFNAIASDSDVPAQTLTYSLDPGAPAGATIHPTTGAFNWSPTEAQGPGNYPVTIRVTDNGSPNLNFAETFAIIVGESNSPPVLTPVANQTVSAGFQVTITNTAVDPDLPINALSFTLDSGAPGGASIHPTSGVFTWTPSAAQAPSTNLITVRVTDNGLPSLSDAKSFTLVVNSVAELRLTGITISSGALVTLNWSSLAGKTYRVESKDDFNLTTWNSEGDFNATNSTTSATISGGATSQRYYRVQQVN
jgi:hypothetical protein